MRSYSVMQSQEDGAISTLPMQPSSQDNLRIKTDLYVGLEPLNRAMGHQGSVPLDQYPHIKRVLVSPIVHLEFRALARKLPLAFIAKDGGIEAVALMGLLEGFTSISTDANTGAAMAPLLVKAFPLAIGPVDEDGHLTILIHQVPDGVPGPFQPAIAAGGVLSAPFVEKSDCLWLFAAAWKATQEVLLDLEAHEAFVPWPLVLVFETGEESAIEGLMTINPAFTEGDAYRSLIAKHGTVVCSIVESQLLSRPNIQAIADITRRLGAAAGSA